MPTFTRTLTDEQRKSLSKPSQENINAAANDLIWNLMRRVEELEGAVEPSGKPSVQTRKRK